MPGLFNVKNNGPFFHDASAATLEAAVRFYNSQQFRDAVPSLPIDLDDSEVADLVAFLSSLVTRGYRVDHAGVDVSREGSVFFGTFLPSAGGATRTLTVRNTSATASVRFGSPACRVVHLDGSISPDFSANCSPIANLTLGPGQSRNITASFDPVSVGDKAAILEILTGDPTGVDLMGVGAPASVVDRFTEDSDGVPPGWENANFLPSWRNSGGQLQMATCQQFGLCAAPHGLILVHNFLLPERFNYTIKAIATADPNDSNDFSVIFNFQDTGNYYYASFNERKDKAGLFKMLDGVKFKLASFPAATPPPVTTAPPCTPSASRSAAAASRSSRAAPSTPTSPTAATAAAGRAWGRSTTPAASTTSWSRLCPDGDSPQRAQRAQRAQKTAGEKPSS